MGKQGGQPSFLVDFWTNLCYFQIVVIIVKKLC